MRTDHRYRLVLHLLGVVIMVAACSPEAQSAAGTLAAPAAATLQSRLLTQSSAKIQTSAVELPTRIVEAGKTGVVAAVTQAPLYLTPARPATGYQIHREDIIVTQVDKAMQVHELAYRFSTPSYYIIEKNRDRYPITNERSVLSPGWTIIIFAGTSGRTDLVPSSPEAWNSLDGCGGAPAGDGISCRDTGLDYTSEKGRLRPECMPNTLAGEFKVLSSVTGKMLYLNGQPFVYGVFWDAGSNQVLAGPAIITERTDEVQCG